MPLAPGHIVAEPKCSVLSTSHVCLLVTTLPPLSVTVTTILCVPWARFLAETTASDAGPLKLCFVAVEEHLDLGRAELVARLQAELELGGAHDLVELRSP